MTLANVVLDPTALRIVFFGPRDSGKTLLLEACLSLTEPEPPEIVPLESLDPHRPRQVEYGDGDEREVFQVLDCDGQAADELLDAVLESGFRQVDAALAQTIRQADALILAVDATTPAEQLTRTFKEFLFAVEEARGYGREVGGWPVLLTLTKCDALLRREDSASAWLDRVERQKAHCQGLFQELASQAEPGEDWQDYLPFGKLDVSVHATAVKLPPERIDLEPYLDDSGCFGVQSVWTTATNSARSFRDRLENGRRRLRWTVSGTGALVTSLLALLTVLLATGGLTGRDLLAERLQQYQQAEPPPAVRFSDRQFHRYHKQLQDIRASASFDRLPPESRQFVLDRLAEFDAYREFRAAFLPPRLGPAEVQTREQFATLQQELQDRLKPPERYARDWAETEAERLRRKWLADLNLLNEAEGQLHEWFRSLIRRGNQLLLSERPPDASWRGLVQALLGEADAPPHSPSQEIAKSEAVPVLRGRRLTFAAAYRFDRVEAANRDWLLTREKLTHLRDLCDSIGLTNGPAAAALDLPEPQPMGEGSRELAATRLASLRAAFPAKLYPDDLFPEWTVNHFPDGMRRTLQVRLGNIRDTATRHVRGLLYLQLRAEAPDQWRAGAQTLTADPAFLAWGQLLMMLNRWLDGSPATNPLPQLTQFLSQTEFAFNLKGIVLALPDDLLDPRPVPQGPLVIKWKRGDQQREFRFQLIGEPKRERPLTRFTLAALGSAMELTFQPGDQLDAEVLLRCGADEYRLSWRLARSSLYEFDKLQQPPTLEKVGPIPAPRLVPDVKLMPLPETGWPVVPLLFPDFRIHRS